MSFQEAFNYNLFTFHGVEFTISKLFWLLLAMVITWTVVRVIKLILIRKVLNRGMDKGSISAVIQLIKYFAYTIVLAILLDTFGFNTTAILASSTALLVGIGLGLQQVFYDLVSGIILLFEGTIRVGDVVEIKHEYVGKVMHIGIRTSKIETRENTYIIVPNSKFISGDVVNWSHITTSTRFKVTVGVAYGSDVLLVKELLLTAASAQKEVEQNPKPFVRFKDFGDSALVFELYFWTNETFIVENLKSDIRFEIDRLFRANNVTIPFPQRDLHIKSSLDNSKI
ncbi:MAG: mechanosensitive ion channel family protein [Bacteroidia bacterium]